MFKLIFNRVKPSLVEETSLSRFVHHASSAEKKRIYNQIIHQAAEEQRATLKSFQEQRTAAISAHA